MRYSTKLNSQDLEVRPFFRVLGALSAAFVSYIFVYSAIPLFSADHLLPTDCSRGRGRLMCELLNWVWAKLPDNMQGPLEGICHLLYALAMAYIAWRLLKPIFTKAIGGARL